MKRVAWVIAILAVLLFAPVIWVWGSSRIAARHEARKNELVQPQADANPEQRGIAEVPEWEHDFGIMDPYSTDTHSFVIRNVGNGPLKIAPGPKTCKCTSVKIANREIPPGGEGEIVISWNTIDAGLGFRQGGSVYTSDPNHKEVKFRVHGNVLQVLAADPSSLEYTEVVPEQTAIRSVLVYSQEWEQFSVEQIEASLDGFDWELSDATAEDLETVHAKCGYRLNVTLPHDLPQGHFTQWVRLHVLVDGEQEPRTMEIPVYGNVLRRLAVYGPAIDENGVVRLGTFRHGEAGTIRLLMKLRDADKSLQVERITTTPKFVVARVTPYGDLAEQQGLYHLEIEVPPDAPECVYTKPRIGELKIQFAHPRVTELTLGLDLLIVE